MKDTNNRAEEIKQMIALQFPDLQQLTKEQTEGVHFLINECVKDKVSEAIKDKDKTIEMWTGKAIQEQGRRKEIEVKYYEQKYLLKLLAQALEKCEVIINNGANMTESSALKNAMFLSLSSLNIRELLEDYNKTKEL